jgi:membrane protein implicated in regulation of membrane protease activity
MEPWMIWAAAAIVLVIVEIFTPSFFAICLAFGALLGSITAGIGMELSWQLLFFAIGSTMAFLFVRPVMKRYFFKKDEVKTGVDALVGRTGRVSEAIDPEQNRGRVSIDGDDWKAISVENEPIAYGQPVRIVKVDSTILYVRKVEN